MWHLWENLSYALRVLRKSPGFTAVAVLSLGLGIGPNTAIFTLINALLLRDVSVREPERLVEVSPVRCENARITADVSRASCSQLRLVQSGVASGSVSWTGAVFEKSSISDCRARLLR